MVVVVSVKRATRGSAFYRALAAPTRFRSALPRIRGHRCRVVLGALPALGQKPARTEHVNGLLAYVTTRQEVYHGTLGATITHFFVSLRAKGMTISIAVGESSQVPGGAPGTTEESCTPSIRCLSSTRKHDETIGNGPVPVTSCAGRRMARSQPSTPAPSSSATAHAEAGLTSY